MPEEEGPTLPINGSLDHLFQESLGCFLVVRRCAGGNRGLSRPCLWGKALKKTGMEVNDRKPWRSSLTILLYRAPEIPPSTTGCDSKAGAAASGIVHQ